MGELESKISDILNSPEEMQKILNIARSFTGGDIAESEEKEAKTDPTPVSKPTPEQEQTPISNSEPESSPEENKKFSLDDLEISPEMLKTLGSVVGELTSNSGKGGGAGGGSTSVLGTITPFLKAERQSQLKSAFSLAKMAKVALGIFTGGGNSKDGSGGGANV